IISTDEFENISLFVIHLTDVDKAGHYYKFNSEKYYEQLEKMDKQIGEILSVLDRKGWLKDCLLVLTTDHGGVGTTHGKDSDLERN
ncbi:14625_t:CDS:1, partial [Racocetra fulgida]